MDKSKGHRKGNSGPGCSAGCSGDLRVLQRRMVYCSGLPSNLSPEDIKSEAYFGQYGQVDKVVMHPFPNRNYCSVYLTFSHEF